MSETRTTTVQQFEDGTQVPQDDFTPFLSGLSTDFKGGPFQLSSFFLSGPRVYIGFNNGARGFWIGAPVSNGDLLPNGVTFGTIVSGATIYSTSNGGVNWS